MNRVAVAIGAVFAVAAVIVALTLRGPGADEEPQLPVGFNNNAVAQGVASPVQVAELIEQVGGDIDRVQIDWDRLEPRRGNISGLPTTRSTGRIWIEDSGRCSSSPTPRSGRTEVSAPMTYPLATRRPTQSTWRTRR